MPNGGRSEAGSASGHADMTDNSVSNLQQDPVYEVTPHKKAGHGPGGSIYNQYVKQG